MINKTKRGFSLVELSIVLVIIGLVTGGILSGKTLIHASELRSITSEHDKFLTAVAAFQGKYLALPGDMTNATDFWGEENPDPNRCAVTPSTTKKTCNGNGDKKITQSTTWEDGGDPPGITSGYKTTDRQEDVRAWQHLANADLITGNYSGNILVPALAVDIDGKLLFPQAKLGISHWEVMDLENIIDAHSSQFFDGQYGNSFILNSGTGAGPAYNALKAEDILNIDTKLDDGAPSSGKVVAVGRISICTTASDGSTRGASYRASTFSSECSIIFSNQF